MNTFSEELRRAREEKNISLYEISRTTRIHLKYLEAIEQGSFDMLPQTYVRAFLKGYADVVGLSSKEILKKYDIMVTGKYAQAQGNTSGSGYGSVSVSTLPEPAPNTSKQTTSSDVLKKQRQNRTALSITASIIALFGFGWYLFNYVGVGPSPTVHETPFQDVVKEYEQAKKDTIHNDTTKKQLPVVIPVVKKDSLVLKSVATDTVWMRLNRDDLLVERMLLRPNRPRVWKAQDQFIVSTGDGGAVRFSLNGKDLGFLGRKGAIVKSIRITSQNLK